MKKVIDFFQKGTFEEWLGRLAVLVVIIPVVINIINRTFLNHYSVNIETIALFAYVWIGYGFFGYLYKTESHVDVKFIVNAAPRPLRIFLDILCDLFIFAFSAYLVYWGCKLCRTNINRTVPGTSISYIFGYSCIVFGFLSGAISSFISLVKRLLKLFKKGDAENE